MRKEECDLNELFIEQFADNELDYQESSEIAAHLKTCKTCKKKYDDVLFAKSITEAFAKSETLSLVEKEGLSSLIDKCSQAKKSSFFNRVGLLLQNRAVTLSFAVFSLACLTFTFIFSLNRIEKENNLIIKEILTAYNTFLPDDFSGATIEQTEIIKNLKVDKRLLSEITSTSPHIHGRFIAIAATPATKIKFKGAQENENGALFLLKKNEHVANVFVNSDCFVKNKNNICKARRRREAGNDLIYWENLDNHFVFVSNNNNMTNKMAQLISSE